MKTAKTAVPLVPGPVKHGVGRAHYNNLLGSVPEFCCLCGWSGNGDTWEEAGIEFDAHLAKVADDEA